MTFLAREAITEAYYLSSIYGDGFETINLEDTTRGLSLLNRILSQEAMTGRTIPYYKTYSFNAVPAQELYFIPNLIEIESETFNIGSVRYQTRNITRKRYFGNSRANNIQSLPLSWNLERTKGGGNLRMYYIPNTNYPINFIGKFALTDVNLFTDLAELYDLYYIDYLIYRLARRICGYKNIQFSPENEQTLLEMTKKLIDLSPIDLSIQKISTLQNRTGYSYADINFGRGWTPPL